MNVIDFGTRKITYNLHRENRKRLRIVVAPELTVDVFAPITACEEQLQASLMKKADWIARKLDALEMYHPLPAPKQYISGETLVYLGRQYRLKIDQGSRQRQNWRDDFFGHGLKIKKTPKASEKRLIPGTVSGPIKTSVDIWKGVTLLLRAMAYRNLSS